MNNEEETRNKAISGVTLLMRHYPFRVKYVVKDKFQGITIAIKVTQEEMDILTQAK